MTPSRPNTFAARVEEAVSWFVKNRGPVLTVIGLTITALVIGFSVLRVNKEKAGVATARLAQAQALLNMKKPDQAALLLADIRKTVTTKELVIFTSYYQGVTALEQKKYDEAVAFFNETIDKSATSPMRPLALSNLEFALEQKKDFAGAADVAARFMKEYADHFMAPRLQLAFGRTLLLSGKSEEAKAALNQLIDLYPTSHWAANARALLAQHPQ